jgi:dUTP pyrophosphatase
MPDRNVTILFKRLPTSTSGGGGVDTPEYQTDHSAGMDLHAAVESDVTLQPGEITLIPCGFAMAIPHGYEAQIRPRSGLAVKHGISMPNTPGTIDADYRGEIKVPLINLGKQPFVITRNMRIAQMVIAPVYRCIWQPVDDLPPTDRGAGGFGHTGT